MEATPPATAAPTVPATSSATAPPAASGEPAATAPATAPPAATPAATPAAAPAATAPPATGAAAAAAAGGDAPGQVPSATSRSTTKGPDYKCYVLDTDMTEDLQKEIIDLAKEAWEKFPIKTFVYKPDEEDALAPELGASFEVSTQTAKEQTTNHYAQMAQYIKTEIDKRYRPCWHVIVGDHFGCFMTHDSGTFIYFDMGEYRPHILMFKSGTLDQPLY